VTITLLRVSHKCISLYVQLTVRIRLSIKVDFIWVGKAQTGAKGGLQSQTGGGALSLIQ